MPRHSLLSASTFRPPSEDVLTAVHPDVVEPPGLVRLPIELLLQIILYLPVESAAAVALISKHYYVALKRYVLPDLSDKATKRRFLRLLEEDLPEYIACHGCNILYRWKASAPRYECSRRYCRGVSDVHTLKPDYCPQHYPHALPLETVAAFLRGYERGPAYGPQLQELHHKCDGALPYHHWSAGVSRDTGARIVNGKLLLRIFYSLQVSLQQSLVTQLDRLNSIGCEHSPSTLSGLVMDAINHLGTPSKAPRYSDYINCAICATDLRVAVLATENDQLIVQVNTWQCYGGRDFDEEDREVQRMFGYTFVRNRKVRDFSRLPPPSRNLELLYNEGLGDGSSLTNGLQQRHRWLHWWNWRDLRYKDTSGGYRAVYRGPD